MIVSEIPSQNDNNEHDSILQALNIDNESEVGSVSTIFMEEDICMEEDTDSNDSSSNMFYDKVMGYFAVGFAASSEACVSHAKFIFMTAPAAVDGIASDKTLKQGDPPAGD